MDITTLQTALGLAASAVGLTGQAAETTEKVKKFFSKTESDGGEAQHLLNALAGQLVSANMTNLQLSEALKSLSAQVLSEDAFNEEYKNYHRFVTELGSVVYKHNSEMGHDGNGLFICPECAFQKKISYLGPAGYSKGDKMCQGCGKQYQMRRG